jgi:hypothetical protein
MYYSGKTIGIVDIYCFALMITLGEAPFVLPPVKVILLLRKSSLMDILWCFNMIYLL